ncbi:hypothetical protein AKJ09_09072 [Labilithrix luteola]|uniref:Uncharacterized protein n=1 Tax=Labilithrix luteola TaxID=1391654 RepID=A0A0K1Q9J7_9BACT|nr:hypothetical protein [Labilithrix luteola]AKV02409.1 hypothetical protein AKJ09_09072 [Labilithrix luteola]
MSVSPSAASGPCSSTSPARASIPQQSSLQGAPQRGARGAEPTLGFQQVLSAKLGHEFLLLAPGLTTKSPALPPRHAPLATACQHHATEGSHPHGAVRRHGGDERDGRDAEESPKRHSAHELDALDPALRQSAQLAPPVISAPAVAPTSAAATEPVRGRMSMEELLPVLVKRIAWAGDKHSGSVRLELGAGTYAGTTLVVHSDAGRVRVEVNGQEGADLDRLRRRLDERLRSHGLNVEAVT